jgi:large subunit ribosomal protein L14
MIQKETKLKVIDNSGVKLVKCINIPKNSCKKNDLGKIITVSIKIIRKNLNLKINKGDIYKGIIFRKKNKIYKKDGFFSFFQDNAVVLLNNQQKFLGSRIIGPVHKKLRKNKNLKSIFLNSNFKN